MGLATIKSLCNYSIGLKRSQPGLRAKHYFTKIHATPFGMICLLYIMLHYIGLHKSGTLKLVYVTFGMTVGYLRQKLKEGGWVGA
jgi:hypothetical protein